VITQLHPTVWMDAHAHELADALDRARRSVAHDPARRRRVDVVLLGIAVLLGGVAAAVGVVAGDVERVTGMWVGAEISSEGGARVTEVIDYDFGGERRHGIFRDVPGLPRDALVTVSSATAPDQVELLDRGRETRIRIGDPSRTISGRHRYRIQYPLDGLARGGRLAWDAVGTRWQVDLDSIEIHVVAPFEFTGARCVQGPAGSELPCDIAQPEPGHLMGRIDTLWAGEGATLYAPAGRFLGDAPRLPTPPSGAVADAGTNPLLAGLLAAAVGLIGATAVSRLMRRYGRERVAAGGSAQVAWGATGEEVWVDSEELGSLATVEATPPEELTAAQGGVVLAEGVRDEHKVAWLLGAAIDGYLDIEGDGQHPTLARRAAADSSRVDTSTVDLLDQAFGDRDRLTLGAYDSRFAAAWKAIGDHLAAWQATSGLWDPAGDRRCKRARVAGVIAAPLGLVLAFLGGILASWVDWAWQVIVVVGAVGAGIALAAVIRAWELRIRTPTGSGLWLRVESFRRFLAASGAHQADEATQRGQLSQYTAWAVALGEDDCWSRAVAASTVAPSSHVLMYDPTTARGLSSAASASSTAPSSSDGGGSSGGGGGGGGGGSW
jgi:hypothetical protein